MSMKQSGYTWYVETSNGCWKNDSIFFDNTQKPVLFGTVDSIWRQGPKGGVKLLKHQSRGCMYVTNNEEAMKEFMLIKLSAKEI